MAEKHDSIASVSVLPSSELNKSFGDDSNDDVVDVPQNLQSESVNQASSPNRRKSILRSPDIKLRQSASNILLDRTLLSQTRMTNPRNTEVSQDLDFTHRREDLLHQEMSSSSQNSSQVIEERPSESSEQIERNASPHTRNLGKIIFESNSRRES